MTTAEFKLRERIGMRILLTADEAYPELELAFIEAKTEIWASFRIFNLSTRLRSKQARGIGETWFDLIVHTLQRGVFVRMILADFDPTARSRLHRATWRSVRMFFAAAELAGPEAKLEVTPALHASQTGSLPRLVFWPQIYRKLGRTADWLNGLQSVQRTAALREMPGMNTRLVLPPGGRARPRILPIPRLFPATHHQKLAVFDRKRVYIGGLDLDERRFDTPDHRRPADETWHDVQLMLDGHIASEAQAHLETFLDVVAGNADPPPQRRLLRTLSRRRELEFPYFGPQPLLNEIAVAHDVLAKRAEKLIYIETQFFRDTRLARALAQLGREKPELGLILILPAAPEEVAFEASDSLDSRYGEYLQARCVRSLRRGFGQRLFLGSAAQPRRAGGPRSGNGRGTFWDAPIVYIHAKVAIFDERAAIVSSANLNGRSLRWDTEAGAFLNRPGDVARLRRRLMEHWLPRGAGKEYFDDATAVRAWRALAARNARRDPEAREGFMLPYDVRAAEEFGQDLPGVPVEIV